jgi:hypothetical protein
MSAEALSRHPGMHRSESRRRPSRCVALVPLLVLALAGCGRSPGEEPEQLEVVEVDAGATANMTP